MFSFFKRKPKPKKPMNPDLRGPMRVEPFSESKHPIAQEQMLEGYVCTGEFGIDQLLDTINRLQPDHPGTHLIASLDDFQASYTSQHASNFFELFDTDGYDLSLLPDVCFDENGEYRAEFNTPEEFAIVEKNFRKQVKEIPYADIVADVRYLSTEIGSEKYWEDSASMSEVLDEQARILVSPFEHAHESLIAFPNGYFDSDSNPFENFELARHLESRLGLKLFGIGSAYLAFAPTRAMTKEDVDTILYLFNKTRDARFEDRLTDWINEHRYVLIPYSEGLT